MNPACTGYPAAQLVDGKPGVWYTEETTIKRGIIMEETRSFGYICPKCGRAVMARRSAFSLAAAAAHIECPCGQSDMLIETDGSRFRLWVPCGLCGETHQAECSADAVLRGRGIGLACPKTRQICCYVGQEDQVSAQMEQLAVRGRQGEGGGPGGLHRTTLFMYEVLSELKDIAAGRHRCRCGSTAMASRSTGTPWTCAARTAAASCVCPPPPTRIWTACAADDPDHSGEGVT